MEVPRMNAEELARTKIQADLVNKKLGMGKAGEKGNLGKDAFLKLLVTELRHQDPTQPMADREFIAQMAQFSTLEQMSNMNGEMKELLENARSAQAYTMLGKRVEAFNVRTGMRTEGTVESVRHSGDRQVLVVGGREIDMDQVHAVYREEAAAQIRRVEEKSEDNKPDGQ